MGYDVFVSYSHADGDWVHTWLVRKLRERGLTVVSDELFAPGGILTGTITKAMNDSRVKLLVLSPSYVSKDWTDYEKNAALRAAVLGSRVIPLLLAEEKDCPIPPELAIYIASDFRDPATHEEALEKLVAAIRSEEPTGILPLAPPLPSIYRNFDIRLEPVEADRYHMRAGCAQINAMTTQPVTIATAGLHAQLESIRLGTADRYLCESVGRRLYDAVFTPRVAELWQHTLETLPGDGRSAVRLRFQLRDRRLAGLPWELVCAHPESGIGYDDPIVRNAGKVIMPPRDPNAKADVLLLDLAGGRRGIEEYLRSLGAQKLGKLTVEDAVPGVDGLQSTLRSGPFDVVHVIAEASHRSGRDGVLVAGQQIDGEVFARFVRGTRARVVVLSTRSAASSGGSDPLCGVAAAIHARGVPAVVSVPAAVSEPAALAFVKSFYGALTDGCPVDACMTDGRNAIVATATLNNSQWALPLLFNDDPDALMFASEPPKYCFSGGSLRQPTPLEIPVDAGTALADTLENVLSPDQSEPQLIGRADILREVWTALNTAGVNNVVLLRSTAGQGKTAVARRVAWEALKGTPPRGPAERYTSVTWLSSGDRQSDDIIGSGVHEITEDGLAYAVTSVFGQKQLMKIEPRARLRELAALFARGRHLMLIDDVSSAAQDVVQRFIEAMPRTVQFVVTSTGRLNVGELDVEIGPLADDEARALAAAVAAESGKELPADAPTFGGNPFIIMAETRRTVNAAVAPVLAEETSAYIRALVPLLPPEQQRVLAVCIQFPLPVSRSIVRDAADVEERAFPGATEELLRTRLIERADESLVLCGTLRALFRDGEEDALHALPDVARACVDALMHFLDEANRVYGSHDSPGFMTAIEPELGNLVWGVTTAYAKGLYRHLKGFREYLDHTLYRIGAWKAALDLGELFYLAASHTGEVAEMGWSALYPLARVHYHRGNMRDAERWCATAIGFFIAQPQLKGLLHAWRYLARVRQMEGKLDEARALFNEIHAEVLRTHGSTYDLAWATDSLAALEEEAGNLARAESLFQDAIAYYGPDASPDSITPALHELGKLALHRNDFDAALRYLERARDLLRGTTFKIRLARILHSIGLVHERLDNPTLASEFFFQAQEMFAQLGAKIDLAMTEAALIRIGAMRERYLP